MNNDPKLPPVRMPGREMLSENGNRESLGDWLEKHKHDFPDGEVDRETFWQNQKNQWVDFFGFIRDALRPDSLKVGAKFVLCFLAIIGVMGLASSPIRETFRRLGSPSSIEPDEDGTKQLRYVRHHWFAADEVFILNARKDEDGQWKWMYNSGTNGWVPMFIFDE